MAVNKQTVDKNSREYLTQKRNSGRSTLLTILIFTVINIVMLVVQADYYFLFSASVPYYLTLFGMIFDKFVVGTYTTSALVIAAVILGLFLLLICAASFMVVGATCMRPYFAALKDIGYTGGVSCECGWGAKGDLAKNLEIALKTMKSLEA